MEPENIGIGEIIKQVHANPEKYAGIIARRVARLIIKLSVSKEKNTESLDPDQVMTTANRVPSLKQIEKISPIVIELMQEHSQTWNHQWEDSEKDVAKMPIHPMMRALVSQACMELLANQIHAHVELSQYIHDNTDLSIRTLHQPERLNMFEHGIIPKNRIFHDIGDKNAQIWVGHEALRKHISSKWVKHDNIITLLRKESENKDFTITVLLRGQNIKIFEDQVLIFRDGKIHVHSWPDTEIDNLPLLSEFFCDFESIENIESLNTKTGWCMHRITGTSSIAEKDEESTSVTTSMTLCVNYDDPSLSFSTHSKRFVINGNAFTLDTTKKVISVLAHWEIIEIPYSAVGKIVKEPNGQEYFTFHQNGEEKKLIFSDWKPQIESL